MSSSRIGQAGESRLTRIESLRAMAALGVLMGHTYDASFAGGKPVDIGGVLGGMIYGGGFGVILFFALTGYLLYRPFATATYGGGRSSDLRRYFLNRAVRILPLYFSAIFILALIQYHGLHLKQWLIFGLMGQTFFPSHVPLIDGPLWSVIVEVHFYIVLPFFAIALAKVTGGRMEWGIILLAVLAIAGVLTFQLISPLRNGYAWQYSLVANFGFFSAGMLLALLQIRWADRVAGWTSALRRSDYWFAVALVLWILVSLTYSPWIAVLASFVTVGACVLPSVKGGVIRALEWRPLAVLGVASYSLYVWHLPIILGLLRLSWLPHSFFLRFALTVLISSLVALLSYRLLEEPWLRLRRAWSSSTLAQSPAASVT